MDANETFKSQTLSIMSAVFEDVVREIGLAVEVLFKDAPSCQVSKFQSELSTAIHPMMTEAVRKVCQLFQSLSSHRDTEVEMSPLDFPASQSNTTEQAQTESQTASIEDQIVNFKSESLDEENNTPEFGLLSEAASQERNKTVQGQAKACERKQRLDKRPQRKRKSSWKTKAAQRSREGDETDKSSPGCVDEPHIDTPDIGQSETLQADSGEQSTPTTETLNGNSPCSCPSSHILTHAKEKPFACDECGATFATATALERHTAVVHKASLTCATCGKAFRTPSLLKVHLRLHTGERPYKCSQCPKAFRMQSCLTRHRVVHTGKKSYVCKTCGACFGSKGNLNRHDLTHTGVRPYVCDKCGKSYTQPSTLKIHMASHDMNMPAQFLCDLCGKGFPFNHVLNTHKRLMHAPTAVTSGVDDDRCEVTCEVCSITFRSVWLLAAHEQVHSGDRRHRCVKCKKDFFHKSSLDDHMRVHIREKHVCSVCGRAYMNKYTMTYHMKVHVEGKSCLCFMCGKRFLTKQALEIHQRSHTGEKPFKCDTCGKGFSNNGNLSRHKLVHTGERPYSCDVCGKRFNQQVAVELHMQVHTGIRPYYCNKCGKGFSDSRHYKKHTCDQKTLEINRPKKGY